MSDGRKAQRENKMSWVCVCLNSRSAVRKVSVHVCVSVYAFMLSHVVFSPDGST